MRDAIQSSTATVVLISALLALSACGGDDGTDDAAVAVADPPVATDDTATAEPAPPAGDCGLTDEQVSAVMGIDMVPLAGQCGWQAPGLVGAVVEVYLSGADATMLAGADGDEVAGVGDEARFDSLDVLNFRIDGTFYYVQVLNMGSATDVSSHDASVELAKLWVEALT